MQGIEVVAQQRHDAHQRTQQQDQRGHGAVAQLLDEPRALDASLRRNVQLLIGVARRKTFVQGTYVLADGVRHPEHLLPALLTDPVRDLHALQQLHKPTQVHRQRQT
ncbi:hypothetical protein D3C78_1766180 [compost metagenome]